MPNLETRCGTIAYTLHQPMLPWVEAPETVLFHHGVGARQQCWGGWLPVLNDRYRVLTFDMPGHGASPPAGAAFGLADLADTVFALAETADAERFHLVGESVGGTVALQFAATHGERLLSLTVSNGAHLGASIESLENWRGLIEGPGGMPAWSEMMMHQRFFPGALTTEQQAWYQRQQSEADGSTVLALAEALVGTDLGAAVRDIAVPTLLLHPDSSPFIPVPVMADLYGRLPTAQLRIFPRARHGLPFSHAGQCAAAMLEFLNSL